MPPTAVETGSRTSISSYQQRYLGGAATASSPVGAERSASGGTASGIIRRESPWESTAKESVKVAVESFAKRTARELLEPAIGAARSAAEVISDNLEMFERRAAEAFSRFGENSPEFQSAVGNYQLERSGLFEYESRASRASTELTSRELAIERGASALGMASAFDKLMDRDREVSKLNQAGLHREAWSHTLGSAIEVGFDGVMSIPNKLGSLVGLSVQVAGDEIAYEGGRRLGEQTFDWMNRGAWWLFDHGLTGGLTPSNPRPVTESIGAPLDALPPGADLWNDDLFNVGGFCSMDEASFAPGPGYVESTTEQMYQNDAEF